MSAYGRCPPTGDSELSVRSATAVSLRHAKIDHVFIIINCVTDVRDVLGRMFLIRFITSLILEGIKSSWFAGH